MYVFPQTYLSLGHRVQSRHAESCNINSNIHRSRAPCVCQDDTQGCVCLAMKGYTVKRGVGEGLRGENRKDSVALLFSKGCSLVHSAVCYLLHNPVARQELNSNQQERPPPPLHCPNKQVLKRALLYYIAQFRV